MRDATLLILLALAPLSWSYEFDDGTKFKDDVEAYIFLECKKKGSDAYYAEAREYRKFYAILIDKKRAYAVDSDTKGWWVLYPRIEDNRIWLAEDRGRYGDEYVNRTDLTAFQGLSRWLYCDTTNFKAVNAWLKRVRAERRI